MIIDFITLITDLHSMSMKLVSSGSYNVRASEMAHLQERQPKCVNCVVHFLDETLESFDIDVSILFYGRNLLCS